MGKRMRWRIRSFTRSYGFAHASRGGGDSLQEANTRRRYSPVYETLYGFARLELETVCVKRNTRKHYSLLYEVLYSFARGFHRLREAKCASALFTPLRGLIQLHSSFTLREAKCASALFAPLRDLIQLRSCLSPFAGNRASALFAPLRGLIQLRSCLSPFEGLYSLLY